jgi:uncharacterized membrane protein
MKQSRLDSLSDGIFAIVLTFLTFELKLPLLPNPVTEESLANGLISLGPVFLSFILSFALIFTYWRAHHFIVSIYAKNVDARLTSINALFFFFIALIPFTTRLLGEYSHLKVAICIYSINIIFIGLSLLWMRSYVLASGHIDHEVVTEAELRRGVVRVIVPMICAIIAIDLSFLNTQLSFAVLTFAIVFNLLSRSTTFVDWLYESARHGN